MDIKSLMIGDWVYDTLSQTNIKVNRGCFEINPLNGIGYEENLIPIPLTPEILEKNGFVTNRGTTSWIFETERDDIIDIYGCKDYHLSINIQDTHGSGKGYRWMLNNLVIFYVHQLQHTLRLCGISKEIEL